jgi:dimethylamine--corrinoid protein Co-methyltransferase
MERPVAKDIFTRMGDGELITTSSEEIKEDIIAATQEAAKHAGIPELTAEEVEQLLDIMTEQSRAVSVAFGREVIVTDDGCSMSFYSGQDGGGVGVPMSRLQSILTYERACAADTTSMGHSDYSYKPVKPIINFEMNEYYIASMMTTAPFLYGAQPNMGLSKKPRKCKRPLPSNCVTIWCLWARNSTTSAARDSTSIPAVRPATPITGPLCRLSAI